MGCLAAVYWVVAVAIALALFSVDGAGSALGLGAILLAVIGWVALSRAVAPKPPGHVARTGLPPTSVPDSAPPGARLAGRTATYIPRPPNGEPFEPWSPWRRSIDVVGENYREDAFLRLFQGMHITGPDGAERYLEAALVDDSANPHDGNAVAIWAGGQHVGYLERALAAQWHTTVAHLASVGRFLVVDARVWVRGVGGTVRARVTVDLPPLDGVWPVNSTPIAPHVVLPLGGPVQVTQEDKHMDVLAPFVTGSDRLIAVTLHSATEARPRSTVELVEVRLDGHRVGVLSPTQTANLLPLVAFVEQRGRVAVARALLRGNALKAEVIVYVQRAQDVEPSWLEAIPAAKDEVN